jgi:hypothetical protein
MFIFNFYEHLYVIHIWYIQLYIYMYTYIYIYIYIYIIYNSLLRIFEHGPDSSTVSSGLERGKTGDRNMD